MSIKIDISLLSHQYTKGQQIVEVNGSTVGQCLDDLVKQFPSIEQGLFDGSGKLHSEIDIYVNGESAYPQVLAKSVKAGDKLHIIFLIGGG
jgi:molybdopterin converting factor small subunit